VLGPVVASLLIPFGAWAPPLGAACLALADLIGVFLLMPETHHRREAPPASSTAAGVTPDLWEVVRERPVLVVLALYFLTFLCLTNIQTALALLAHERLGWGEAAVGRVFGLFGLVSLVVQGGLIGQIARRLGRTNVLVLGAACAMGGLAAIASAARAATLLAGVVAFAFGVGSTLPLLASVAADYAGSERQGVLLGIAQSAGGLARTVGPVWAGLLFARFGAGAPFWGGVVSAALWLALCLTLRRR
jgi:MFS transporter, DHA1 family, tetracycline resistance protein